MSSILSLDAQVDIDELIDLRLPEVALTVLVACLGSHLVLLVSMLALAPDLLPLHWVDHCLKLLGSSLLDDSIFDHLANDGHSVLKLLVAGSLLLQRCLKVVPGQKLCLDLLLLQLLLLLLFLDLGLAASSL